MVGIFSGLLLSCAFEPLGLWFLAPIAFLTFFIGLKKSKHPVVDSFLFGLVSNLVALHWSGKYVGITPWIILSILQALFYIPVGLVFKRYRSIALLIPVILALEELRARFPFGGFAWTRIGFSQVEAPYINVVSIGGALSASALVLLLAALLFSPHRRNLLLAILILVAPLFLTHANAVTQSLNVIGIQGNTPSVGLGFNERAKAVFDLHVLETKRMVTEKYDLIVWPENAVDLDPISNAFVGREIADLAVALDTPLIVGAVLNSRGSIENASMMYTKSGEVSSIYVKRHLTPFGEYMPLRKIAEVISPYAQQVNDFTAAQDRVTHRVNGYSLGPIICYELIDDGLVRDMAIHSNALIVQTNSATFAGTAEGAQQLAITRIRAIEHNRDVLSVSTVGISALLDNNGNVIEQSQENVAAAIAGKLPMRTGLTISDRLGGVAPLVVLFLSLMLGFRARKNEYLR